MNETIGVKGGKNDRRRRMIITREMKEKLEKYYKEQKEKEFHELEKKVKLQQKLTALVAIPIAAAGQIYETFTNDSDKKKALLLKEAIELIEKENMFSESDTKEIINALKSGNIFSLNEDLLGKLGLAFKSTKQVAELDLTEFNKEQKEISPETKTVILNLVELSLEEKEKKLLYGDKKSNLEQVKHISPDTELKAGIKATDSIDEKLNKLKNHKIIEEYEHELKDVRKDLRELIFEYNVISEEADNVYDSKEADILLERLNSIIKKMEELKRRLNIPDIDKYDDNYLYTLVEDYIKEFKNKNFVSEIKDSALYIMISEKLEELEHKKDNLQANIDNKKSSLELDEMRMEQIKDKHYSFEKFNNEITKFQVEQDKILEDIKDKMAKAVSIQERVETQVVGMNRQSRRLLALMAASMMLPGARTARSLATMSASYLYFMRNIIRPNVTTRTLRSIKVEDYRKEIESSIDELDNVSILLTKTTKQIDATIKEVETEFGDYLDNVPECRELLANLEKIKQEIEEKEYELKRIKEEQEKNLEKNNAKVLKLTDEHPM